MVATHIFKSKYFIISRITVSSLIVILTVIYIPWGALCDVVAFVIVLVAILFPRPSGDVGLGIGCLECVTVINKEYIVTVCQHLRLKCYQHSSESNLIPFEVDVSIHMQLISLCEAAPINQVIDIENYEYTLQ